MIDAAVEAMYSLSEENRFLEVTYANGEKEVLYFKDFSSGAMIESIVRRAKKLALKRYIGGGAKGISADDLLAAVREEFKENEDLPNTTQPRRLGEDRRQEGRAHRLREGADDGGPRRREGQAHAEGGDGAVPVVEAPAHRGRLPRSGDIPTVAGAQSSGHHPLRA